MSIQNFLYTVIVNDTMYFFGEYDGLFYEVSIDDLSARIIPLEKGVDYRGSSVIGTDESFVYAILQWGKRILRYDTKEKQAEYNLIGYERYALHAYGAVIKDGNYFRIYPIQSSSVIVIDYNTLEVVEEIKGKPKNCEPCYVGTRDMDAIDFVFSNQSKELCSYKGQKMQKEYSLMEIESKVISISYFNRSLFVLCEDGNVYRIDSEHNTCLITGFSHENSEKYFGMIYVVDEKIWLLPWLGEEIVCYDLKNNTSCVYTGYPKDFSYSDNFGSPKYTTIVRYGHKVFFNVRAGNYMMCMDDKGKVDWRRIQWPLSNDIIKSILYRDNNVLNEKDVSLVDYIDMILSDY